MTLIIFQISNNIQIMVMSPNNLSVFSGDDCGLWSVLLCSQLLESVVQACAFVVPSIRVIKIKRPTLCVNWGIRQYLNFCGDLKGPMNVLVVLILNDLRGPVNIPAIIDITHLNIDHINQKLSNTPVKVSLTNSEILSPVDSSSISPEFANDPVLSTKLNRKLIFAPSRPPKRRKKVPRGFPPSKRVSSLSGLRSCAERLSSVFQQAPLPSPRV